MGEQSTFSFSAFPDNWHDILKGDIFIISMDDERYSICKERAVRAGFNGKIIQSPGVNRDDEDELEREWKKHPFLPSHKSIGPHPTAVMLAHLNLWKHIIEHHIPYAVIFEDDILFHTDWHKYASRYYEATPKKCDMIYLGHHCGNAYPEIPIVKIPVYCTNAYTVTYDGVKKLYEMMTTYPYQDFGVIDMMIVKLQADILFQKIRCDFEWYAWNTQMFPDHINEKYKHPQSISKDMGLVFQQYPFFKLDSDI